MKEISPQQFEWWAAGFSPCMNPPKPIITQAAATGFYESQKG
ncbi:MAG: hypothetical protein ABSF45_07090 [Terriglobia bacterium]|jgi:hypothetical protein